MRKILLLTALLLGVLNFLWHTPPVLAYSETIWDGSMPSPNIKPYTDGNSLTEIDYWVSSTGATSGIRYKTIYYYITMHRPDGTSVTFSFQPTVSSPPPRQTIINKITVTAQDLLGAGFTADELQVQNFDRITISATIQIYNAYTGTVYATIGDANSIPETIYPVIDQVNHPMPKGRCL